MSCHAAHYSHEKYSQYLFAWQYLFFEAMTPANMRVSQIKLLIENKLIICALGNLHYRKLLNYELARHPIALSEH